MELCAKGCERPAVSILRVRHPRPGLVVPRRARQPDRPQRWRQAMRLAGSGDQHHLRLHAQPLRPAVASAADHRIGSASGSRRSPARYAAQSSMSRRRLDGGAGGAAISHQSTGKWERGASPPPANSAGARASGGSKGGAEHPSPDSQCITLGRQYLFVAARQLRAGGEMGRHHPPPLVLQRPLFQAVPGTILLDDEPSPHSCVREAEPCL